MTKENSYIANMRKRVIECFDKMIESIDNDDLTDVDKLEFFDVYRQDIIDMLVIKKRAFQKQNWRQKKV